MKLSESPRINSRIFLLSIASRGLLPRAFRVLLVLSLVANAVCIVSAAPRRDAIPFPDYLALPMLRGRQDQPLLRARINDRAALVYLDTGSPVTCVDESQSRAYGLAALAGDDHMPMTVNANGSTHKVTLIAHMTFGSLRLENTPAVLIDFREINRAIRAGRDKPNDAILGLDTLAGTKAIVDFENMRLLVKANPSVPDSALGLALRSAGWSEIPMHLNEGHLALDATVNKIPAELLVDTGSPASVLDRAFARAHPFTLARRTFSSRGIHFQDSAVRLGRVDSLQLGSFRVNGATVAVFDLSRLLGLARNTKTALPHGLIGCETLARYRAYIDCKNMKLYLRH